MNIPPEMTAMWNSRYAANEYAYGMAPNQFLKTALEQYDKGGDILFPAEGEGRNAVYAATQKWNVTAFDISTEGQKKALKLATGQQVKIDYEVGDFMELELRNKKFDAAALIYAHFPTHLISLYHQKIAEMIKPMGLIILEGFSKGHLPLREENPAVGGPSSLDMLFSLEGIQNDFSGFEIICLEEVEIQLSEGLYHNGAGKVIRFIGQKPK